MNNIKKVDNKRKNMGLYSEIKEAREQSKATKREHLYKLAVEAGDILPPLKEAGASCSMTLTSQA